MKSKKEEVKVSEYTLFQPKSGRGLYFDYPEIRNIPEFKELGSDSKLLFVWYYACEASPYFGIISDRERTKICFDKTFRTASGKLKNIGPAEEKKYLDGDFPEKMINAIDVMRKFRVGPRVMALKMTEKSLENLQKILDVDASNDALFLNKDNEVDFAKKKSFVEMIAKANDTIPTLLNQLEGRYYLSEKKGKDDDDAEESYINTFHDKD